MIWYWSLGIDTVQQILCICDAIILFVHISWFSFRWPFFDSFLSFDTKQKIQPM
ncbi:hypothetical protein GYMLUDRAFT_37236 [Collybiopsis luxurians FD-317 M1]|nr:hypothetical protein GYMLUDRAFT_37236 [Collybiopsis luxurians FD-317 M1]